MTLLIGVTLSSPTSSTPLYSNIQASQEIGPKGGSIMAEDPETGVSVGLSFPDSIFTGATEALKTYLKDLGVALPEKEDVPEIEPDLLVKFGDGKTYFGGEGKKIVDNSEGSTIHREEFNFSWQVTRKKKPL